VTLNASSVSSTSRSTGWAGRGAYQQVEVNDGEVALSDPFAFAATFAGLDQG
jgi:hypothetical protein